MKNLIKSVRLQLDKLEGMLSIINEFQKNEPDGLLKLYRKRGNVYYYHQYVDPMTKGIVTKYLRREDMILVRKLAQKQYYSSLRKILENDIKALRNVLKKCHHERLESIYDKLDKDRKTLIEPIPGSKEDIVREWKERLKKSLDGNLNLQQESFFPEDKKFSTEQGELVRSKSEVIIANILYSYCDDIIYIYEHPLTLCKNGKMITIYPDFTIINVHTGKITYWEHAGKMDDLGYVEGNFMRKINLYAANDLLPGQDVLFTFETSENPLDISLVKKLVKSLL